MDINELHELLRVVKDIAPDAKWDTDDEGNVVIHTYLPFLLTNEAQSKACLPNTIGGISR